MTKAWTEAQYWEFVGALAGNFILSQMQDALTEHGLAITAPSQGDALPRCAHGNCLQDGSGENLAPPCGCTLASQVDAGAREALVAAKAELRKHDGDYKHRTKPGVYRKIDAAIIALRAPPSDAGALRPFAEWADRNPSAVGNEACDELVRMARKARDQFTYAEMRNIPPAHAGALREAKPYLTQKEILDVHAQFGRVNWHMTKAAMGPNWPTHWENQGPGDGIFEPDEEAAPPGVREIVDTEEKYLLGHFDADCGIMPGDVQGSFHRIRTALASPAPATGETDNG